MKRLALAAILLGVTALPALAQDTITYKGHEIEPETEKGPVQCLSVQRDVTSVEDLDGIKVEAWTYGVILIDDVENGWLLAGTVKEPAVGAWDITVGSDCTDALGEGE
jgi:hypothetical protein